MLPGTRPTVLLTLAVTGGTPNANRVGNVINVPDPTTVLMVPAATPARAISRASIQVTRESPAGCPRGARVDRALADRRVGGLRGDRRRRASEGVGRAAGAARAGGRLGGRDGLLDGLARVTQLGV